MLPETTILRDLLAGQSTADSLAPRCRLSTPAAEVILVRLVKSNQVIVDTSIGLRIYRLTDATREQLRAPTNPTP